MTAFFVLNPQLDFKSYNIVNTAVLHQLGWRFDTRGQKTIAHLEFAIDDFTGRFTIEYISKTYLNISVRVPLHIADTKECFMYIRMYVQCYQQLLAKMQEPTLA